MVQETIYCIMVTNRPEFIDIAISNFKIQTYSNKKLILVNNSDRRFLNNKTDKDIFEYVVEKKGFTLGKLRNIALTAFVPIGGLWTTYDDDDWRAKNYLEELYKNMKNSGLDIIFLRNRLECNLNTGFIFRSEFKNGRQFFLARHVKDFAYDDLDSLEDMTIKAQYEKAEKKIGIFHNDAKLYIRIMHTSNTSVFVDKNKKSIVRYSDKNEYHEFEANNDEIDYVRSVMKARYSRFIGS